MGPEAERAKSFVNPLICTKETRVSFTISIAIRDSFSFVTSYVGFLVSKFIIWLLVGFK
jgi:hypothetical protein